jgi:outer membrane protein
MRWGKPPIGSRHRVLIAALLAVPVSLALAWVSPSAAEPPALRNSWDVTLGAGLGYEPDYEGAKGSSVEPLPYFDITWYDANGRERTFLNVDDGLGLYVISTPSFRLGPLVTWRPGRRERWSSDLRGLGNADSSFQAGAIAEVQLHECCYLFLKGRHDVATDNGTFVDLGGELTAPLATRLYFTVRATTTWASRSGMQPLFGITPEQSAASGLGRYSPSSGMRDLQVQPGLIYDIDGHWAVAGRLRYERLLDHAADSPLIRTHGSADQFATELQLLYHF